MPQLRNIISSQFLLLMIVFPFKISVLFFFFCKHKREFCTQNCMKSLLFLTFNIDLLKFCVHFASLANFLSWKFCGIEPTKLFANCKRKGNLSLEHLLSLNSRRNMSYFTCRYALLIILI